MQNKPGANKQIKNTKAALFKMYIIGKNSQETFWCYSQRNMKKKTQSFHLYFLISEQNCYLWWEKSVHVMVKSSK